jgi:hypothetical protein
MFPVGHGLMRLRPGEGQVFATSPQRRRLSPTPVVLDADAGPAVPRRHIIALAESLLTSNTSRAVPDQ